VSPRGETALSGEHRQAGGSFTPLSRVFEPAFLRKLERLQLRVSASLATRPGNTPMPRGTQPSGIELANYKPYGPGDDLRYLDWNAYGRLDQLVVKTFRAEREAPLHLFLDCSASMRAPASDGKFDFAVALAAALAYVSIRRNDPARVVALLAQPHASAHASAWFRHRDALGRLRQHLAALESRGSNALAEGLRESTRRTKVPGVALVVSDFLVERSHYEDALLGLVARGWTLGLCRLLGPGERDPGTLFRRGRLRDSETGRERVITLSPANRARYQAALQSHIESLRAWCRRHGASCAVIDPSQGLERALFETLPAAGIVRGKS
jgi:uncharacterized protein (DUF58 family)